MNLAFTKMNGAGNDFVLVDDRAGRLRLSGPQIAHLCHRQRGIGADGLVLLRPCGSGKADWAWVFHNSDGSAAEMCGNAARCFARFVRRTLGGQGPLSFETLAGIIRARVDGDRVTVSLTSPGPLRLNEALEAAGKPVTVHSVNTGVPHAVVFVEDADRAMVQETGSRLRYHPHFAPKGTNVNFVQIVAPNQIRVRTYERGVEGETLACGTGVTASALIASRLHGFVSPVRVRVQGGDELEVAFRADGEAFGDVELTGPAEFVFEGTVALAD
jgi:diaminopimelate epimerase